MNTKIVLAGLVLLLVAGLAAFAKAEPMVMAGQAKTLTVELTNTKSVAETLDLSIENQNTGIIAEVEQKALTLKAGERRTVNVIVKALPDAREGTYSIRLVGKKMVTVQAQPQPMQPVTAPGAVPAMNQPMMPIPPVYGQAPAYNQALPGFSPGQPGRPVFYPTIPGRPPLLVDEGEMDVDGALAIEAHLSNAVDPDSVRLGVRNELFDASRRELNVRGIPGGAIVEFADDFFEKKEIVPVFLALGDSRGNEYRFSYAFSPVTLAVEDPRLSVRINELDDVDPTSVRFDLRANDFGGTFTADGPGISLNPVTGEIVADLRGAPLRLGSRIPFSVYAKDLVGKEFRVSGDFVLDFDDRLAAAGQAVNSGDTLKDFVDSVDRQKYRDYILYRRNVTEPYINSRNYIDSVNRQMDIDAVRYGGPIYPASEPFLVQDRDRITYFQDAEMDGSPYADAIPFGPMNPFLGDSFPAPEAGQFEPRETVREEVVFEKALSFRVVNERASTAAPSTRVAGKPAKPNAAQAFASPVRVTEAGTSPVAGFVSFSSVAAIGTIGAGIVVVLLLAFIVGSLSRPTGQPTVRPARTGNRLPRKRTGNISPAMHVILNYRSG
ncbi:MAG: hypothetical protein J4203_03370 [Candidatus Diapherotrites archaeon]|uniref:Uncharacterized protein n=2 Tax=Candidatus Iainarchaeum sp. TaxID=3101447 RepID=A0A8T4L877_9ARCH|nr:hypothetical protein [Candidatus Diapherotrites archaeon]